MKDTLECLDLYRGRMSRVQMPRFTLDIIPVVHCSESNDQLEKDVSRDKR